MTIIQLVVVLALRSPGTAALTGAVQCPSWVRSGHPCRNFASITDAAHRGFLTLSMLRARRHPDVRLTIRKQNAILPDLQHAPTFDNVANPSANRSGTLSLENGQCLAHLDNGSDEADVEDLAAFVFGVPCGPT